MFEQLPKEIQEKITHCLHCNDFAAAKALYDAWLNDSAKVNFKYS